ncbi:MAG: N-acetylglucosamine kinase [Bacteroidia bacterium]
MILIADSGSTKTEWRLVDKQNHILSSTGQGLNPFFHTPENLNALVGSETKELTANKDLHDLQVFFYGSGCGSEQNKARLRQAIQLNFRQASIEVESDLLGAARALWNKKEGITAILGTGMSSCVYNGSEIILQQPSLGYILGDEGSGADLGKNLIRDYLNGDLPSTLKTAMESRFQPGIGDILTKVYREPLPNRFLASFSKFIYQNLKEQYCVDLVSERFRKFFEQHIIRYPGYKALHISFCGSVAFWFSNILRAVAEEKGIVIDRIVETPMAGLCLYHLGEDFTVK